MATKLIKNQHDIMGIRHSCHKLAEILHQVGQMVKPGVTTLELEEKACKLMADIGGRPAFKGYKTHPKAVPFPTALCTSINNTIVHGPAVPAKTLQAGDIIGIDVGMKLNGYYSDMARTYAVGRISNEALHLIQTTKKALDLGIAQMKPGNTLNDIGTAIQKYVEANNLSVVRDLVGHGVGVDVHEEPQIPHYAITEAGLPDLELKPGMVLAIEPMVNTGSWRIKTADDGFGFETSDGQLSAHFENTILITVSGHEILTQ